jgi:multicomponent K+:H+ antiporter subunit C
VEILVAGAIGLLTACGIYLMLRGSSFPVALGLMLLSYAVTSSSSRWDASPSACPRIVAAGVPGHADPLPQALVLTAIVIGLATTVFAVVLALVASADAGEDPADARPRPPRHDPRRR